MRWKRCAERHFEQLDSERKDREFHEDGPDYLVTTKVEIAEAQATQNLQMTAYEVQEALALLPPKERHLCDLILALSDQGAKITNQQLGALTFESETMVRKRKKRIAPVLKRCTERGVRTNKRSGYGE